MLAEAGLNPYLLAMANIREHCSWITKNKAVGTAKAKTLISGAVRRVVWQEPLIEREVPVTPVTMVVGGGIAGIQAALTIADAGYNVFLVEKDTSIGGRMAQLDKTFPTLDCSACILTPKMVQAARHPNITLLTNAEVDEVSGYVGNFQVKVKQKARYVDVSKCSGCGECTAVCPVSVPHEFDQLLSRRKAIYRLFPQAVPGAFAIDKQGVPPCRAACPAGVNVQGYVALIGAGKYAEALERDPPQAALPRHLRPRLLAPVRGRVQSVADRWGGLHDGAEAVCGRLGTRAGERVARRRGADGPLRGRWASGWRWWAPGRRGWPARTNSAKKGYAVTVFEALPVAGGMMAVGIPDVPAAAGCAGARDRRHPKAGCRHHNQQRSGPSFHAGRPVPPRVSGCLPGHRRAPGPETGGAR